MPEQTDVIRNEVGRVLGDNDALAETNIRNSPDTRSTTAGSSVGGQNDLQEAQVARRD